MSNANAIEWTHHDIINRTMERFMSVFAGTSTRFVVAIDFGTARSGYAFSTVHDEEKIAYRSGNWPDQPFQTSKTPTLLLLDSDGRSVRCGYSALKHLATLSSLDAKKHVLADMFKMSLHGSEGSGARKPQIKRAGKTFDTFPLVVDYLKWMRSLAIEQISGALTGAWKDKEVRWCLTVPAIWSNEAKGLMRQAAIEAGLIDGTAEDSKRLNLVLEPEAAAIYCQVSNSANERLRLKPGDSFMVVDCGGGTLDITTHRVTNDGGLDSLSEASGGPFGSMYVDREWRKMLEQLFGTEAIGALSSQFPAAELKMLEEWERIKCSFAGQAEFRDRVSIHNPFYGYLQKHHSTSLEKLAFEQDGEDFVIFLNAATMKKLFAPVLQGIIDNVRRQLRQLPNKKCDYLFLVGGFAESRYLQAEIKTFFNQEAIGPTRLVIPIDPGRAILGGAVAYGLNPALIRTRRSRYTYGIGVSLQYDELLDKGRPSFTDDENIKRCGNRFCVYVRRGESIPVDHEVTIPIFPVHPSHDRMEFEAYRTRSANPRYYDESGVTTLNKKVSVALPMGKTKHERRGEVTMRFGGTEVSIVLVQPTTGERVEATFDLASCYFPEDAEDE